MAIYYVERDQLIEIDLFASYSHLHETDLYLNLNKKGKILKVFVDYCNAKNKPVHGPRIKVYTSDGDDTLVITSSGGIDLSKSKIKNIDKSNDYGIMLDTVEGFVAFAYNIIMDGHYGRISYEQFYKDITNAETCYNSMPKEEKTKLIKLGKSKENGLRRR